MNRTVAILFALWTAVAADGIAGQRRGSQPAPDAGRRMRMEQMIRGRFDALVQQQLGLTDEQGERLQEVLEDFRQRRREFVADEQDARRRLMDLGAAGEIDDQRAGEALEELLTLREAEVRLFREEQEALMDVLSARQLLRLVVMREQLNQRIQSIRGGGGRGMDAPSGRRPGRGSGPPGGGRALER